MKPKIIMHTQISLDGRIKGFDNPEAMLSSNIEKAMLIQMDLLI
ncbi:hypothetical protein SUT007_08770 [Streptococcus parasuis]|nr:hypothetical protein SUT007_08770 [Streptococcus parasuis]